MTVPIAAPTRINLSRARDWREQTHRIWDAIAGASPGHRFRLYVGTQPPPPTGWGRRWLHPSFIWELEAADSVTQQAWRRHMAGEKQ